ncbi:MAG: type IV pilus assembly protein PilM [bacterium]
MASNACWGVEVGAGALKAIKLVRDGDDVKVADFAYVPHTRPLSAPETDEADAKRLAVGTLVSQKDLGRASLAISIAGHSSFARFAKLPPVEPKKIPDIVKFEAVQQIPFPIDDVQWDYQTFVQPGSPDVEVGIFAITTEKVNEKLAKWQDVSLTPDILTLSPLAAYNALAYDMGFSESMPGTAILDIGTTSSDLIVAEGGRMWIRTFPIGGHQFTEALSTAFNISYVKAEKLKKEAENGQYARQILQAMRPVFGDLAQDVQRSLSYYQSAHRDAKLARIVGLGATFQIPGLRTFLKQQVGMEVVRLESFSRIKVEGERAAEFAERTGELATAYGLALQGLGMETIGANLMPVGIVREALWKSKTPWFAAAAALALAAGGASFLRPAIDSVALGRTAKSPLVTGAQSEAQSLKNAWTAAEAEDKPDPRAAAAMSLLEHREVYGFLAADMGRLMAAAESKVGSEKIVMDSFSTEYTAAPAAAAAAAPGAGQSPGVPVGEFGGRGLAPGAGGAAPPPPAAPMGAEGGADSPRPRVVVTLTVTTTKKGGEADRFVNDTIVNWLKQNTRRDGVPYFLDRITLGDPVRAELAKVDPLALPGALPAPEAGGRGLGGRGIGTGGGDPGRGLPPSLTGRQGPQPLGGAAQRPGVGEVNSLAPLPPSPLLAEAGAVVSTYKVTFEAVLTSQEKKEGVQ